MARGRTWSPDPARHRAYDTAGFGRLLGQSPGGGGEHDRPSGPVRSWAAHTRLTGLGYLSARASMKFLAVVTALPVSALAISVLLRTPVARRVVAAPRGDRWHQRATPLLGG